MTCCSLRPRWLPSLFLSLLAACLLMSCAKAPPKTSQEGVRLPAKFSSLSSFVAASVETRGHKIPFDAAVLIQAPNRLRVEILNDFGEVTSRLVADGSRVLWWQADKDEYTVFPQASNALKKTLKLPLSIEEFIQGMLVEPVPVATKSYRVEYSPALAESGYPARVEWLFSRPSVQLTLRMESPKTDAALPAAKFDTRPPEGARPAKQR